MESTTEKFCPCYMENYMLYLLVSPVAVPRLSKVYGSFDLVLCPWKWIKKTMHERSRWKMYQTPALSQKAAFCFDVESC